MIKNLSISNMRAEAQNIFEIDNPDEYLCRVHMYQKSHSWLSIEAHRKIANEYKPIFMKFGAVRYFEGPMWWEGANFYIASLAEYIELLGKFEDQMIINAYASLQSQNPEKDMAGHLFVAKTNSAVVKIVADLLTLTDQTEFL